ncbi:MAG TPA: beta-ketoacyl-ACP synthase III [Sporichthyaceae bacterium]|nr:beta-ketoacyl-ACP synthase III [Sporichthyaceae bacterium]
MTGRISTSGGAAYSRILSVGGYRPALVVTNEDICQHIDSTDEWIRSRSGIAARRFAAADETIQDMSVAAGGKAIAAAGISPEQIGLVIVASCTTTVQIPAAAPEVAHRLGSTAAAAFDVNIACAGFSHGVALGDSLIRTGAVGYALIIGTEKFSPLVDPTDRSIAFIFGDGSGAAVLGPSDTPAIGPVVWGADGSQAAAIAMDGDWVTKATAGERAWLTMNGQQVFRWASYAMAPVARQAVEAAGLTLEDLDAFIPHQANMRITDAMARALKLPSHVKIARDIVETGNTSAASIPLAMETMVERGEARTGDTALLIGFGAGLSFAAQVVTIP